MRQRLGGFSLIELMVVVVIVAILMRIAIPQYRSYLVRGNRSEAEAAMMEIAQRQQQYLLDSRAYATTITGTGLNYTVASGVTQYYTITMTVPTAIPPSFTVTATPITGTIQATDSVLTINQAGTKTPGNLW
jgi:type IV pilus assembly protein PilE